MSLSCNDAVREWGNWLKAPPRRVAGQERSRWLRDERDVDWGTNHENANCNQHFSGSASSVKMGIGNQGRDFRGKAHSGAIFSGNDQLIEKSNILAVNINSSSPNGPTDEELHGLNIDERKRRRGLNENEYMETEGGNTSFFTESNLSKVDCADSSPEFLATLARQASHPQCIS
ncbi:hypothetical protein ACET3Z_032116 [Daucus carota]